MLNLKINYLEATALAVIIYYLGVWLKNRVSFLRNFFIPEPVIGGLVFAVIKFALFQLGICKIELDNLLQMFFMSMFFTSVGFAGKASFIKKGGKRLVLLAAVVSVLIILQNILDMAIAKLLGQQALLGIAAGSMPMVGGHGSAGVFGPVLEEMGVRGALPSSMAMATFGLIMGGLLGGPIAGRLVEKYHLRGVSVVQAADEIGSGSATVDETTEEAQLVTNHSQLMRAMALLLICMGIGALVCDAGEHFHIYLPPYAGGICVAALLSNIASKNPKDVLYIPFNEIVFLAEIGLNIFLSMALMSLNLWQLMGLFGPLAAIAVGQMLLMALFTYFVVFPVLGKTYETAVMIAGICGFGLGAVPTGMANMQSITNRFGAAPFAFLMIPIVGSLADGINATIIVLFISLFK